MAKRFIPKWLSDSLKSKPKNATLKENEWWSDVIRAAVASGVNVSPLSALGITTVFACVNAVSRSIASLPLKLYKRLPDGGKVPATDHYLYTLLHDAPNNEMTSVDFRRAVQANATLRQSGYALIVRDGRGNVAELWPILNKDISPVRDDNGALYYNIKGKPTDAKKVLHIKGLTFNGVAGMDTVGTVREAIGLAIALQDHGSRFFVNSSTPSVLLELPNAMNEGQLKEFAKNWDALNSGNTNAHKRSILWGGAKFGNVTRPNNEQSQFIEAKVYQDKCIAQAFGVPQIKAGITDAAHFNNVEQENQNYVTDTLMSWCAQWEQSLNQKLLSTEEQKEYYFEFILEGLLRGDIKTRYEAYQLAIQNGIMTRNEARSKENLNPYAGGDQFIIPMNMQLLDASGMPVKEDSSNE